VHGSGGYGMLMARPHKKPHRGVPRQVEARSPKAFIAQRRWRSRHARCTATASRRAIVDLAFVLTGSKQTTIVPGG